MGSFLYHRSQTIEKLILLLAPCSVVCITFIYIVPEMLVDWNFLLYSPPPSHFIRLLFFNWNNRARGTMFLSSSCVCFIFLLELSSLYAIHQFIPIAYAYASLTILSSLAVVAVVGCCTYDALEYIVFRIIFEWSLLLCSC